VKGRIVRTERAVDLVGGDVEEAEALALFATEGLKVRAGSAEESEGAFDVGLEECFRPKDGAVDMALCGEVNDRARALLGEELVEQGAVVDVAGCRGCLRR
jgi:hypothetical protein